VIFILPLFLQNILELSPIKTGLMLLTMTAMYGALSPFVGKLLDRVAYKYPLVFSLIISLIACILVANLQFMMSWWFLLAAFILFGISRAFIFSCSVGIAMHNLPKERIGAGIGAFYVFTFVGGICGVAFTGVLISFISWNHLKLIISKLSMHITAQNLLILKRVSSGSFSAAHLHLYFSFAKLKTLLPAVKSSFIYGLSMAMWIAVLLSIIALGLSFCIKDNV